MPSGARSSSQSPLCSGHPSVGIRHGAPLLLLSPPDPLCWDPAGAPIFCADRKLPKSCPGEEGFRVPYPFCPFGTFPTDRGNRPPPFEIPPIPLCALIQRADGDIRPYEGTETRRGGRLRSGPIFRSGRAQRRNEVSHKVLCQAFFQESVWDD